MAGCDQLIEEAEVDLFEPSEFTPYSPTQEHFQSLTKLGNILNIEIALLKHHSHNESKSKPTPKVKFNMHLVKTFVKSNTLPSDVI